MRKKCCLALITFSMRGDFMNTKLEGVKFSVSMGKILL